MSFDIDMAKVYQQYANVFGSLMPLLFPFIGCAIALFVFGGIIAILVRWQRS